MQIMPPYMALRQGPRMLVSAPRPDSAMLRLRSLREAGVLNLTPGMQQRNITSLRQGLLSSLRRGEVPTRDLPFRLSAR